MSANFSCIHFKKMTSNPECYNNNGMKLPAVCSISQLVKYFSVLRSWKWSDYSAWALSKSWCSAENIFANFRVSLKMTLTSVWMSDVVDLEFLLLTKQRFMVGIFSLCPPVLRHMLSLGRCLKLWQTSLTVVPHRTAATQAAALQLTGPLPCSKTLLVKWNLSMLRCSYQ